MQYEQIKYDLRNYLLFIGQLRTTTMRCMSTKSITIRLSRKLTTSWEVGTCQAFVLALIETGQNHTHINSLNSTVS